VDEELQGKPRERSRNGAGVSASNMSADMRSAFGSGRSSAKTDTEESDDRSA
jgi:hypothetical protein